MTTPSATSIPISSFGEPRKQMPEHMFMTEEIRHLTLRSPFDAIIARAIVRSLASSVGYTPLDQVRISIAVYEIARNMVTYAGRGEIIVSWQEDGPQHKGLLFFCHDCGLNEPRLAAILEAGGNETNNKLNFLGLRKLVDEFEYTKDSNYGNCVTITKWMDQ